MDNSPRRKRRHKKSLKRRIKGGLGASKTRDKFIYIAVALVLGFIAGMMILKYIGE